MAEIELAPLTDRLEEDEVKLLHRQLEINGATFKANEDLPSQIVAARLSEEALTEFLDRLDAHDVAAEIYLPVDLETTIKVGEYRVASTQSLADALEEIKEELDVEDEDDEDEDAEEEGAEEEDDVAVNGTVIAAQLRHIWRLLTDASQESLDKGVPLHIHV